MITNVSLHLLAVLLICCLNIVAFSQSGRKPQGQQEKPVVKLETREVVIPLNAFNADGKFVDDLTTKDVLVLEEGEARPIASLKREPANIVLVLDLSNEIGTFKNGPSERFKTGDRPIWETAKEYKIVPRPTAREFAEDFLSHMSPADSISIIQYSDKVQLVQDWTNDSKQALVSLNSKYRVGIKSRFYDAMKLAAEKLQTRQNGRRVILLVSDGLDSDSKSGRTQAMTALSKSRAAIFIVGWADALKTEIENAVIWMNTHDRQNIVAAQRYMELRRHLPKLEAAALELRQLGESSGGNFWLPATHEDLIKCWKPVTEEIGAQYSLTFVTERKPSLEDERAIRVIPARRGLNLHSRYSYYVGDDGKP